MHTINLQLPTTWQALTDKQLRFVLHLLASDHTAAQVKGPRGQVPVTHMATQWEGLEEVPGMPNVNSL